MTSWAGSPCRDLRPSSTSRVSRHRAWNTSTYHTEAPRPCECGTGSCGGRDKACFRKGCEGATKTFCKELLMIKFKRCYLLLLYFTKHVETITSIIKSISQCIPVFHDFATAGRGVENCTEASQDQVENERQVRLPQICVRDILRWARTIETSIEKGSEKSCAKNV